MTATTDPTDRVRTVLERARTDGTEEAIGVCVYEGGSPVVDLVVGAADPATGRPLTASTPLYNYSIGKAITSVLVHRLVDSGALAYDTPVADVWPEFAQHDKGAVTVRHVLNHTAGIPQLPLDTGIDEVCDWDGICATVAGQELWWEPGTQSGYHAYTFGFIAGEVIRRASGRSLAEQIRREVAGPLGIDGELWFGVPAERQDELAVLVDGPAPDETWEIDPDSPMAWAGPPVLFPTAALGNDPRILTADIPAGGKVTARALARMYAGLLTEVDGVRLLSPRITDEATAMSFSGPDMVFGNDATWALGFALGAPTQWDDHDWFGMAGAGGSWAGANRRTGRTVAITKNVVSNDFALTDAVMRELG